MGREESRWFARQSESARRRVAGRSVGVSQDPPVVPSRATTSLSGSTAGAGDANSTAVEQARLLAKAETISWVVGCLRDAESKCVSDPDGPGILSTVRFAFEQQEKKAWDRVDFLKHSPLAETDGLFTSFSPSVSASGDADGGLTAHGRAVGETPPSPLNLAAAIRDAYGIRRPHIVEPTSLDAHRFPARLRLVTEDDAA